MNDRTNGAPKPDVEQPTLIRQAARWAAAVPQERIAALDTSGAASVARIEELEAQLASALAAGRGIGGRLAARSGRLRQSQAPLRG